MGKIRTSRRYEDPTPHHIYSDHVWFRKHQIELLEQYGPCIVLVYQEKVIGVGNTEAEAIANAEANLPAEVAELELMPEWTGLKTPVAYMGRKSE